MKDMQVKLQQLFYNIIHRVSFQYRISNGQTVGVPFLLHCSEMLEPVKKWIPHYAPFLMGDLCLSVASRF